MMTAQVKPEEDTADDLLSMDQAIEILKTTRPTFYRWLKAGKIKGMKLGRQWRFHRKDVDAFLSGDAAEVDLPVDIQPMLDGLHRASQNREYTFVAEAGDDDVIQAIKHVLGLALHTRASDVHISPLLKAGDAPTVGNIRLRIDGVLQELVDYDLRLQPALIKALKGLAACDVTEVNKPQDGRIMYKPADDVADGPTVDVRVCFMPVVMGESATLRLLVSSNLVFDLEAFDFEPDDLAKIRAATKAPNGMILTTGPTGSGKTTTMYSLINQVSGPDVKTMSIEDPVEYLLPWVTQTPVRMQHGVGFAPALRAILRSDPDVLMVGEIRDRDTIAVCNQAALTGHLVISCLHTEDAVSALKRLVDIGTDPYLLADSTQLIIAQRLVRKICPHCAKDQTPSPTTLDLAKRIAEQSGVSWDDMPSTFKEPVGCPKCSRGYRGRTVVAEVLPMSVALADGLNAGKDSDALRAIAVQEGMQTIVAHGLKRASRGETSLSEVVRVLCGSRMG